MKTEKNEHIVNEIRTNFGRKLFDDLMREDSGIYNEFEKTVREELRGQNRNVNPKALIEISNYCQYECKGCELRQSNYSLSRYRLSIDEIVDTAKRISNLGLDEIVLKSGFDLFFDTDFIAYVIYTIKNLTNARVTLSLGLRNFDEYRAWKIAGADNYLIYDCNCYIDKKEGETSFFKNLNVHLNFLNTLGYRTYLGKYLTKKLNDTGEIVGFIEMCLETDPSLVSVEPVLKETGGKSDKDKPNDLVKLLLLLRGLLPGKEIAAHPYFNSLLDDGVDKAIKNGCDTVFIDFTPGEYILNNSSADSVYYSTERLKRYDGAIQKNK